MPWLTPNWEYSSSEAKFTSHNIPEDSRRYDNIPEDPRLGIRQHALVPNRSSTLSVSVKVDCILSPWKEISASKS